MHNGHIGGFARIRRRMYDSLPDEVYQAVHGNTDSEAAFAGASALSMNRARVPLINTDWFPLQQQPSAHTLHPTSTHQTRSHPAI